LQQNFLEKASRISKSIKKTPVNIAFKNHLVLISCVLCNIGYYKSTSGSNLQDLLVLLTVEPFLQYVLLEIFCLINICSPLIQKADNAWCTQETQRNVWHQTIARSQPCFTSLYCKVLRVCRVAQQVARERFWTRGGGSKYKI